MPVSFSSSYWACTQSRSHPRRCSPKPDNRRRAREITSLLFPFSQGIKPYAAYCLISENCCFIHFFPAFYLFMAKLWLKIHVFFHTPKNPWTSEKRVILLKTADSSLTVSPLSLSSCEKKIQCTPRDLIMALNIIPFSKVPELLRVIDYINRAG